MKAVTDIRYYDSIAKSINYSKTADYKSELATDTEYFNDIGEAIVSKDGGEMPDKSEMADRIEAIPTGSPTVSNPALVLWDWEGTKLAEYSAEDALALTELPVPSTLPAYATSDHELLLFQSWNWSLANIKTWIQNHEGKTLDVGAIYTTTDGHDHNYWGNPRLDTATTITMQKRGTVSIDDSAFFTCYSLTQINIPDGVTSIGNGAFYNCRSLTQINIPDGVTRIGNTVFDSCLSLTQINIPDSVTSIGTSAFNGCRSLTQINIPDGVTSIGTSTFNSCLSLTQINIPDGVTSIGNSAFNGCRSLTQINIPDGVTSIGTSTFNSCLSLTQINIPDGVTSIGGYAFDGCLSFTQINIPDSVTSIGNYAFQNCYSLTQINIPDSVTSIESNAFNNCYSLCDILLESKPTLSNINAFNGLPTNYRIYVPRSDLSWFETATNWSTIYTQNHIVAIEDYIEYLESLGFNVDKYKEV